MNVQSRDSRLREGRRTVLVAAVLASLGGSIAIAGAASGSAEPHAVASVNVSKQVSKLKRQVQALQRKVDQLQTQPGPQGPPGPQGAAGSAPPCEGSGAGDEMVAAGGVCIDKYEASIWSSPTGGVQYGVTFDNYPCEDDGQNCTNIYARSVSGVTPSRFVTWFQAQQALANAGERLPTSAEWQQAVVGTPDSTACNVSTLVVAATGANTGCASSFGAMDMVGNLDEWVADWMPGSTACLGWGAFSDDVMCLAGASTTSAPGGLQRGGNYINGVGAGPLAVAATNPLTDIGRAVYGFRGAR